MIQQIRIALLFLLGFLPMTVNAQIYPVQTVITTQGPFYNYLSYYADQNNHLQLIVTLTDFNSAPISAHLRIRIEGPGYEAYTNPNQLVGTPFILEPGVPVFLNNIDLQPYFLSNNLVKSPANLNTQNLPGGDFTICIDVVRDGPSQEVLSTNNCRSIPINTFQVPEAFPGTCEQELDTSSLFHVFRWTAPLGYAPQPGFDLNYTFSLYEWVDPTNYSIFQTGQGLIYQEITSFEQIQISDFDVVMQPGMHYVWRVQAQVTDNANPIFIFENNGLSEPCSFTYGQAPSIESALSEGLYIDLDAEAMTQLKGRAYWTVVDNTPNQGLSTFDRFYVEYRKKPNNENPNPLWHHDTITSFNHFIYQLSAETTYEVRVSGINGSFTSEPSNTAEFTTPAAVDYACGDQQLPYRPNQFDPNDHVTAGNQVQIGQFLMTVTEAIPLGSAGHYSGQGTIPIDFLAGAKAKVRFDDILIDEEYFVREGRVDVKTEGVDAWLNDQYQQFIDPIYVNGTIDSAWVDTTSGSAWIVVDGVSQEFVFDPPDYPIIINDASGYQWTIWPNGTITVSSYLDLSNDYLDVNAANAGHFQQNDNENFGFDGKENMEWHENYEVILLSDSSHYFVPNKSIGKNEVDLVDILVPSGVTPTFKLDDQTALSAAPVSGGNGTLFTVTIPTISQTGEHAIYAYDGTNRIAKVNVHVYKEKEREVVIVPLTNAPIDQGQLTAALEGTLGEANLAFTLTIAPQWNDVLFTPTKTIELPQDFSTMTKYSNDMRDLRDAYFNANPNASKNAYYLFVVPSFDDPSADGYMVRGKALGFVKSGSPYLTYAHELGHGMGALEHSWKNNGSPEGTTDNLMDYSNAQAQNLTKKQWKELRDFDLAPSFWDDTQDGNSYSVNLTYLEPLSNQNSFSFFDLHGHVFSIPKTATRVDFSTMDRLVTQFTQEETDYVAPIGSVLSFELNGDSYAFLGGQYYKRNSLGHVIDTQSNQYIDSLTSIDNPDKVITSFFTASYSTLKVAYFLTDTLTVNLGSEDWIVFDQGTIPWSSSLSSYVNHYKSSGTDKIELIQSLENFGVNTNPLLIMYPNLDTIVAITPASIFEASPASISVDFTIKYLLLCNKKAQYFQQYSACLDDEMRQIISPIDLNYIIEGCTTCVQLNNTNTSATLEDLESHFQQAIESVLTDVANIDYSSFNNIANTGTLDEIKNWLKSHSSCVIFGMPPSTRAKAFNRLMTNDSYWNWANLLLKEINEENTSDLTTFVNLVMDAQYGDWIGTAIPQLSEFWEPDGSDFDQLKTIFVRFTELIGSQTSNPRLQSTEYTKTFYNELNPLTSTPASFTYTALTQPVYFAKTKIDHYVNDYTIQNASHPIRVQFQGSTPIYNIYYQGGKVHVVQHYTLKDATLSIAMQGYSDPAEEFYIHYELSPYENVSVHFLENFATELGFDEGENIVVPAFYLLLLKESVDHANWHSNFRVITDAIEIVGGIAAFAAAPLTGGGTLALLGAYVAATDIAVEQNRFGASTDELAAFEDWDRLYASATLLTGAASTYTLFSSLSKPGSFARMTVSYKSLMRRLGQLPVNAKQSLLYLRNAFGGANAVITPQYTKSFINSLGGFSDDIASLASQQGLSVADFKVLQQKRYDLMTNVEKIKFDNIRNSIATPDNITLLQKVIPKSDIQKYISGQYTQVGGFVSTAKDSKHLVTFEDMYYGLRLDYTQSNGVQPYSLSDGSCGVIRYKTDTPNAQVPYLNGVTDDPLPFTGNGMTGGNNGRLGAPEWTTPYNTPVDGSELWEVYSNGTEVLRAVFDVSQNKFIIVL